MNIKNTGPAIKFEFQIKDEMREINTEDKRNQGQRSLQNQSDGDKFSKETIKRKRRRRCG